MNRNMIWKTHSVSLGLDLLNELLRADLLPKLNRPVLPAKIQEFDGVLHNMGVPETIECTEK